MPRPRLSTQLLFTSLTACSGRVTPQDDHGDTTGTSTSTATAPTGMSDTDDASSSTGEPPPPYDPLPGRPDLDARRPCTTGLHAFVDPQDRCDGHTPCFTRIAHAVDSTPAGATLWVFPGTYTRGDDEFVVDAWHDEQGTCIRSVEGPSETILDGEGDGPIVSIREVWIEGFTLRGAGLAGSGSVYDGWAMWIDGPRGYAVGNDFESNKQGRGALYFDSDVLDVDALISGNLLRDNSSLPEEAAIVIDVDDGDGGPVGEIRIENNVLIANEGGALKFRQLLASDLTPGSMGVPAEIANNTFSGGGLGTVGIHGPFMGISVHNNILSGYATDVDSLAAVEVGHNLFENAAQYMDIDGNVLGDAGFVDAAAGDVHILASSPAQGLAAPAFAPAFDLSGAARDPKHPDAGAYEVE